MKAGEWECDGCYVRNASDKTACVACTKARPGYEQDKTENNNTPSAGL